MSRVLLNAPRVSETNHRFITKSLYRTLKSKGMVSKDTTYLEFKAYALSVFNSIIELVIENRSGVMLPEFIGHIFIGSCESKCQDYNTSNKLNKDVKHQNYETLHNTAKIFFSTGPTKYKAVDQGLWALNEARTFSKRVSIAYLKDWKRYIKVAKNKKIAYLYKVDSANQKIKETSDILEDYNELEI